jgi:hypothetical protein
LAAFVLSQVGCRDSIRTLADRSHASLTRAEQMFASLGARVTDLSRDAKYDTARVRIAKAALLPSRVWSDTSVWTSVTAPHRSLLIGGRFTEGRYRLDAARTVPPPAQPAESRHLINLTRLSDDEYAWDTDVAYAIGSIAAAEIGAFVAALFASAEGRTEREVRADYGSVIPLTASVLGQLFGVDSIRTTALPDQSTIATFAITLRPAGVEKRYPHYAQYLRRYAETARMSWTLTDRAGTTYLELSAARGKLLLRVRTLNGGMVSLAGPARSLPDSLQLNGALSMKVRRFTVGFRDYHADFAIVRTDHERTWSLVSRREPKWDLPLATESLLRAPLKRPFRGNGALFRIGVRDSAGAQSLLTRRLHLEVEESMILRFLGRLGAIAVGDYHGDAEREQLAWLREVFDALVADLRALGSGL